MHLLHFILLSSSLTYALHSVSSYTGSAENIWDYPSPIYFQKYQYINIHVGNVGTSKEDQEKSYPVVLFTEDTNITLTPGPLWYFTALCSRFGAVMLNKSWLNDMYRQVEVVPSTFPLLSVQTTNTMWTWRTLYCVNQSDGSLYCLNYCFILYNW